MSKHSINFQPRRSTRSRVPVVDQPSDLVFDKAKKPQGAAELDVVLKDSSDEPIDPDASSLVSKTTRDDPKKLGASKSNVCGASPPLPPPDDPSTPKKLNSNQLKEIGIDAKGTPSKKRRVRKKINLFALVTPTSTSQPQEQETSTASKEKVEFSDTGELPSLDEPSEPANTVSEVVIDSNEETGVKELASINETSAQNSTIANKLTEEEKEFFLINPSIEEPSEKESSVEEPSVDNPSLEGTSVELPSVEDPLIEECYSSQDGDSDSAPFEGNEDVEGASMDDITMKNVSKSPNRSSKSVRRSYEETEKRKLVADAYRWGVRPIARQHNILPTTLRWWMIKELGDVAFEKDWGLRRTAGEAAFKDWLVQKMAVKERVSHEELRKTAMEFILPHNPNFYASNRWIIGFLNRHEIDTKAMTIHGKDVHCPPIKHFSSPSKKQTTPKSSPRSKPTSTPEKAASGMVTNSLGKRKSASVTPPSKRKQPKRETPKKANLSVFDFND